MWVIVVFRLFLLECHEHIIAEKSYRCVTDFAWKGFKPWICAAAILSVFGSWGWCWSLAFISYAMWLMPETGQEQYKRGRAGNMRMWSFGIFWCMKPRTGKGSTFSSSGCWFFRGQSTLQRVRAVVYFFWWIHLFSVIRHNISNITFKDIAKPIDGVHTYRLIMP